MELNIKTAYWRDGKVVKLNSSKDVDRACGQAVIHMRRNRNKADYVEVWDAAEANLLHLQIKRSPATGKISIYDRKEHRLQANRYAATPFVHQAAAPRLRRVK